MDVSIANLLHCTMRKTKNKGSQMGHTKKIKIKIIRIAVKPVYNNHSWDPKKVAVENRRLLCIGF
jgi:hypothetical protein